MKPIAHILAIIWITSLSACSKLQVDMVTTTQNEAWKVVSNVHLTSTNEEPDLTISRSQTLQSIEGFGACFNELGWLALKELSDNDRQTIMDELFTPNIGANFTICRMPVGANDFSRDWYSYNETEGDFAMQNFSIDNDLNTLIPFIKEAESYKPDLKIWASPWSPPSWMKWNKHYACAASDKRYTNGLSSEKQGKEGTNMFIQEDRYFEAYALYFSKFIEAYRTQNINIAMVMPQNEFNSCQVFPSCTWTAAGLAKFIGEYLGPAMANQNVELMFGTMERPTEALVDTILNDPKARQYITGIGFQWAGKGAIQGINTRYPNLKLYQTEQECGNGKNDWKHCKHSWNLMKHYLTNGTSAYLYWNIALKEGGISRWGWSQNSLLTIDSKSKTYHWNHEYYLMKHISHFVKPGAKMLQNSGNFNNALAFENEDKSLIIVAQNNSDKPRTLTFRIDEKNYAIELEADSFNSMVIRQAS